MTIRCMKQSYGIENVRLGVPAHYALRETKRFYGIPNFRYYALAVGLTGQ